MEIKFKKSLKDFDYLVMFDLASKTTGVCLFDLKNHKPISTSILKVTGDLELPSMELKTLLKKYFDDLENNGISRNKILVSFEAMPTQVHGGSSTIQTFLALAKAHATLDNFLYENNFCVYDYVGVYPISTHSYLKTLENFDKDYKVKKEDIKKYLIKNYNILESTTLDETDAIFLAITLVDRKWDNDINEMIRENKRHKKELKMLAAKDKIEQKIEYLTKLKNN